MIFVLPRAIAAATPVLSMMPPSPKSHMRAGSPGDVTILRRPVSGPQQHSVLVRQESAPRQFRKATPTSLDRPVSTSIESLSEVATGEQHPSKVDANEWLEKAWLPGLTTSHAAELVAPNVASSGFAQHGTLRKQLLMHSSVSVTCNMLQQLEHAVGMDGGLHHGKTCVCAWGKVILWVMYCVPVAPAVLHHGMSVTPLWWSRADSATSTAAPP
mmetsp:Transcript_19410/g.64106  ORF Transcript_19410/g.64106 Transcript_19410/m.64106 type:complete len:214 (-) Transcript_19410:923-1564(-)